MDLDSKILNFTKKALWKQVEGYKGLVAQKESELAKCNQDRIQAERISKATELILTKIASSLSQFDKTSNIHESLVPLKNLLDEAYLGQEFSKSALAFLTCISQLISSKQDKIIFRELEPVAESRKDLLISEFELSIEQKNQKISLLENKIFSLEKRLAVLQQNDNPLHSSSESPSKRPRTDSLNAIESSAASSSISENDQNTITKLNVLTVELEELQKVYTSRTSELDVMFAENQKLKCELKFKTDQLNRIPSEFLKDGASVRQLTDDLKRLKNDLTDAVTTIKLLEKESNDSSYRHNKILSQFETEVKEKYTKLEDFIKSTDSEISRIRKDRDHMRQLYEHTNGLLASCQKQISSYQVNISISETAIKSLTETIGKLKVHISTIPGLGDNSANLSTILDNLRADEQLYVEELENLGRAFEQIQSENANFIKKIMEKDETITKLIGEKMKAEFISSQIQKETESSLQRAHKIEEISKHRVSEIEAREDNLLRQVSSLEKSLTDRMVAADGYKSRLSEANAEVNHLRSKIDRLSSEFNDMKALIPQSDIKSEYSYEKRRLTEELSIAKKKLDAYAASGVGLVKELEEELIIYKKLMKCNSCHIRDKNAVILKCMHCFCKNCLDIRLETRQRKCPNCGDPFGAGDVKQIYL